MSYPIYEGFNQQVYQNFKGKSLNGDYDIVHAMTPMMPRYPFKVVSVCQQTPFILGPVNGGIPFPPGFQETGRQEFAQLNFLRTVGRALIPGYVETYKKADKILAGSTYTLNMLKNLFAIPDQRIDLFYENGIAEEFFNPTHIPNKDPSHINLLFVGRLVPYKCADIVIESIGKLDAAIQSKIRLTIVGDGSEKNNLQNQVKELNLGEIVSFAGLVNQQEILDYYRKADIFCFPSMQGLKTVTLEDITSEGSQASPDKLIALIILIALAMTPACLQGKRTKLQGQEKYVCRLHETGRTSRRHSNFWIGLYGSNWLITVDSCQEWVESMLRQGSQ